MKTHVSSLSTYRDLSLCDFFFGHPNVHTGCFFLSDIFETLITPLILKISRFCKVVMTNKTGIFDILVKKFMKTKLQHVFKTA